MGPRTGPAPDGDSAEVDQQDREEEDLRSSLDALSLLSTSHRSLTATLTAIAGLAAQAIPGADGVGLMVLQENRSDTVVTTSDFVAEVDETQYRIGQGPCLTAAAEGTTVLSNSLGADPRWRNFGSRVARLGVHSALSLPLLAGHTVIGALNVYAREKNAFDDRAAELGHMYAEPAAIAVQNANVLSDARRLALRLQTARQERSVIDQALGILMSRTGGTPEEALDTLRTLSQQEHRKLPELAGEIVDQAVRRARARHTADD